MIEKMQPPRLLGCCIQHPLQWLLNCVLTPSQIPPRPPTPALGEGDRGFHQILKGSETQKRLRTSPKEKKQVAETSSGPPNLAQSPGWLCSPLVPPFSGDRKAQRCAQRRILTPQRMGKLGTEARAAGAVIPSGRASHDFPHPHPALIS